MIFSYNRLFLPVIFCHKNKRDSQNLRIISRWAWAADRRKKLIGHCLIFNQAVNQLTMICNVRHRPRCIRSEVFSPFYFRKSVKGAVKRFHDFHWAFPNWTTVRRCNNSVRFGWKQIPAGSKSGQISRPTFPWEARCRPLGQANTNNVLIPVDSNSSGPNHRTYQLGEHKTLQFFIRR